MKKIIISILALLASANVLAGTTYPHEIMIINCTHQPIFITNGDKQPYKFSMDPHFPAINGFSPVASLTISGQTISTIPATVFINSYHDGAMHLFLTMRHSGVTTEVYLYNEKSDYLNYRTDSRFVKFYGYRNTGDPAIGTRSILGVGCDSEPVINGAAGKLPVVSEFKVALK